jgi:hypothetical protein
MSDHGRYGTANDSTAICNEKPRRRLYHYQLGAPALIYHANRSENEWSPYRVPTSRLPTDAAKPLYEKLRNQNRVKARWNYALDVDKVDALDVPHDYFRTKRGEIVFESNDKHSLHNGADDMAREQQACRLAMLVQEDPTRLGLHRRMVEDYRRYESPYLATRLGIPEQSMTRSIGQEKWPRLKESEFAKSQEFQIHHDMTADSSYLANFVLDGITAYNDSEKQGYRKPIQEKPKRLNQGNTMLVCPCPCPVCAKECKEQSWILFHPKGHCMERLCASNLIPPRGKVNAGSVFGSAANTQTCDVHLVLEMVDSYPNEVDLDDTILEIRQCSVWKPGNLQLLLSIRTGTHVSVVTADCRLPPKVAKSPTFDETQCWGCYVLEEKERLDFRSITRRVPSFQPISLTSHPKFGNQCTPSRFAFACHAMGDEPEIRNRIYLCNTWNGDSVTTRRHDITNLRKISLVDFASSSPMCLWSAAMSYVRPTIAAGVAAKITRQTRGSFGLGTSLYSIDLRTNSATFQWSPSAEEFTVEGVHSISGIMTDWKRDNIAWVTSSSARKTWEIDVRMPARSVTCWSLTSMCDTYKGITVPKDGFHGESVLLVPTMDVSQRDNSWMSGDAPFVKVDTDYGTNGLHLYQRPLRGPRFQTDSPEGIATPGIDFTDQTSIATSSYFGLPDIDIDTYVCGLASLRLPLESFVGKDENVWDQFHDQDSKVLCILTINSHGDVFTTCLLENSAEWITDPSVRFDNLPVGTRAVGIPEELDGRSKHLAVGHQKPTCGMDLKLFLTNNYPLPRKATVNANEPKGRQNEIAVSCSRRKRMFDDSGEVIEIIPKQKPSGVIMTTEDGDHPMLQNDEQPLKIPAKLAKQAGKRIALYDDKSDKRQDDGSDVDSETPRNVMSDLTTLAINETLESLDKAIQLDDDTDEDEDDDDGDV